MSPQIYGNLQSKMCLPHKNVVMLKSYKEVITENLAAVISMTTDKIYYESLQEQVKLQ